MFRCISLSVEHDSPDQSSGVSAAPETESHLRYGTMIGFGEATFAMPW